MMQVPASSLVIALLLPAAAAAADTLENPFCEKPDYVMMSAPAGPPSEWKEMGLLNPDEKNDPQIWRKLAFRPGAYGHSELGLRYLARLIGYPGRLGGKEPVEKWITDNADPQVEEGLRSLWDKWAVNPKKRLAVPNGAFSEIPNDGDPVHFFHNSREQKQHARCVIYDLARLYCENQVHDKIVPDDHVYFSATRFGQKKEFCKISMTFRPLQFRAPASESIDYKTATIGNPFFVTVKRSYHGGTDDAKSTPKQAK
jgi:hypothetical protein